MSMFDWVKCEFQAGDFDNNEVFQTKDGNGELALFLIQECGHMIKIPSGAFSVVATSKHADFFEIDRASAVTSDDYLGDLTKLDGTFEFYTPLKLCKLKFFNGLATEITIENEA